MDTILDHVNISPIVDQLVQGTLKTSPLLVRAGSSQSLSRSSVVDQRVWLPNIAKRLSTAPLALLTSLCNLPMPIPHSESTSTKDISATLQQIDVRLEQALNSKEQFEATRLENVQNVAHSTARYINFFNCVWLIVNDAIIGLAVGGFICDNKDILAQLLMQFMRTRLAIIGMQASLETMLAFLNHFPLFALMLRVKDPARLPGGIELRLESTRSTGTNAMATTRLKLVNKPIPFSRIFFQHFPSNRMVKVIIALQSSASPEVPVNRSFYYAHLPVFDPIRITVPQTR
ncbi:phosphatidylinositol N-acetylglucosaminyltransferase subunit gpi1 [Ceratobasidium sp. 392]|nr:phosphatidylinositol N-acetylglucosaminyltransferase subunit gpi1 [Ceratobasidium sp. 392]